MKKKLSLLFLLCVKLITGQVTPVCTNTFYSYDSYYYDTIKGCSTNTPTSVSSTSLVVPWGSTLSSWGLATGSNFGFTAPNPTFWIVTTSSGVTSLWYYNGSAFASSTHTCFSSLSFGLGSSKNYIYMFYNNTSQVYKYNGTGSPTLVASITPTVYADIVGDDQDNFYLLGNSNLYVYNSSGAQICTYSVSGLPSNFAGESFAIVGNTITASSSSNYYVGTISASSPTINFVAAPLLFYGTTDFASCPLVTTFSSTLSASPNNTINCLQTLTLSANPGISPVTYAWSGPGISGPANNQTVSVTLPGTYSCYISNGDCPPKVSTNTISVINAGGFFTPTVTSGGSLTCTNATTQVYALPNSASHTFLWSGPGIVGSSASSTLNLNVAGTYSVLVTNTLSGCSGTKTISVSSGIAPLTLSAGSSNYLLCMPYAAGATLSANGAASYSWSPSSSLNTPLGSSVIANPTVSSIYTVSGQTGVCSGSAAVTVYVGTTPTLVSAINPTICQGTGTSLWVSGAPSCTWLPGNLTGTGVVVSPLATTIYTILGDAGGCISSTTATITLLASPSLSVSSSSPYICLGTSATLTASGANSYTWLPGGTTIASIAVSPTATSIYTITGVNLAGCTSTLTKQLPVLGLPFTQINPATPTVCSGYSVALFSSISSGTSWFPGGSTSSLIVVSPTVNTTYTLTVSNASCSGMAVKEVTVLPSPNLSASWSATNICAGSTLNVSAGGATAYTLNPGGLTGTTNTLSPLTTGTYVLIGSNGTCSNSVNQTVSVTPIPNVTSAASNPSFCVGGFSNLFSSGALNYTWNPGGLAAGNILVSPTVSTIYTLTGVTGICSKTNTLSITVYPLPVINIGVSAFTLCAGNNLISTATGASSYTWLPLNVTGSLVISTPVNNITFTVIGEDQHNCKNSSITSVSVITAPQLTLSSSQNPICSGSTVTLTAIGATNFTWNPGNVASSSLIVSPSNTSSYTLTTGNPAICATNSVITLIVNLHPTLTASASQSVVCSGKSSTLQASGATTYTWQPGNVTGSSPVFQPISTTIYTVTGENSASCSSSLTLAITTLSNPIINAIVSPSLLCLGESATISVSGANTYTWNNSTTGSLLIITPTVAGVAVHSIVGNDVNGCESLVNQISIPVQTCDGVEELNTKELFTTFYPNPGTGSYFLQLNRLPENSSIQIYNAIGELIHAQKVDRLVNHIHIGEATKGIYLLVLKENGKLLTTLKIIKE